MGSTARVSSPAFCGAAAAVCGVWAGKKRESEGKRSRRAPWFWCAREKGAAGSVLAGPRRRRGGSREEVLGSVACMHQASGAAWVATGTFQATCGGQRNARGGPGATQSGGRRGDAPATAETEASGVAWVATGTFQATCGGYQASRRWPAGRSTAAGAAPLSAGGENRASRLGKGIKDLSAISKNSRDPTVKPR